MAVITGLVTENIEKLPPSLQPEGSAQSNVALIGTQVKITVNGTVGFVVGLMVIYVIVMTATFIDV